MRPLLMNNEIRTLQPPHSREAEQQILAGMLYDLNAAHEMVEKLKPEDFYLREHQVIFRAMVSLLEDGRPLDVVTLPAELENRGELNAAGGGSYVDTLATITASSANIGYHADLVRARAMLRSLIQLGNDLSRRAHQPGADYHDLLNQVQDSLYQLSLGNRHRSDFVKVGDAMITVMSEIENLQEKQGQTAGLSSGYPDLDRLTGGFAPGQLVIIAGRPGMGKTAFALNLARQAAESRHKVALMSLEMTATELGMRWISMVSGVELTPLKRGDKLKDHQFRKLAKAGGILSSYQIYIDDSSDLGMSEVRSKLRRLAMQIGGVDLLIIDYLQLMRMPPGDNQSLRVANLTRNLKILAKDFQLPVLVLSQLSRESEKRTGSKRPILSDLRDSGAIEQDADIVIFVHRDEMLGKTTDKSGRSLENITLIDVSKNRSGPTGKKYFTFLKHIQRFEEYLDEEHLPESIPQSPRGGGPQ